MNSILKLVSLLLVLTACTQKEMPSPYLLWQDFQARQAIKSEKFEDALQNYYSIVESDSSYFGTHSNIGLVFNLIQKPEDALKSLEHALKVAIKEEDLEGQFKVRFNLGVYFTNVKKIEAALENYQAALELKPTSVETKTNIELLIQEQQKQNKSGEGKGDSSSDSNQNKSKDDKDNKDSKNNKEDQNQSDDDKNNENKDQKRESSAKYKPRPFQGEQLSEGDVKKILGELRNQEQKIRANFDKKEKRKSIKNEKDW